MAGTTPGATGVTREETKAAAAVMIAWADGKEIQCNTSRTGRSSWGTLSTKIEHMSWNWDDYDYRINQEPREFWIVVVDDHSSGVLPAYGRKPNAEVHVGKVIHVKEVI